MTSLYPITLSSLSLGQHCTIEYINGHDLQLAMLKLGVTTGASIVLCNIAPLGDPIAIAVNGTKIAICKSDAAQIIVKPI